MTHQRKPIKRAGPSNIERFIKALSRQLGEPLPGEDAQWKMAPLPRHQMGSDEGPVRPPRRGGVLVLFYPHRNRLYLPLILRPTYEGVHSGQVAFPGGGVEEEDVDVVATALREAYEEVGVLPESVDVLGTLSSLYIKPSNYHVFPTVAFSACRPDFKIDPYEVANLLEVPMDALLDPANRLREEWQLRDRKAMVPYFSLMDQTVWGATAMILSELLHLIEPLLENAIE